MQTLVIYDIHDDANRTRLSKYLQKYGLTRVQYSAFKGELNPHDRMVLIKKLHAFTNDDKDSIFVIPLCGRCLNTVNVISKSSKVFTSQTQVMIV